jgi:hypothetical protein
MPGIASASISTTWASAATELSPSLLLLLLRRLLLLLLAFAGEKSSSLSRCFSWTPPTVTTGDLFTAGADGKEEAGDSNDDKPEDDMVVNDLKCAPRVVSVYDDLSTSFDGAPTKLLRPAKLALLLGNTILAEERRRVRRDLVRFSCVSPKNPLHGMSPMVQKHKLSEPNVVITMNRT